jgi:hypothetical protein
MLEYINVIVIYAKGYVPKLAHRDSGWAEITFLKWYFETISNTQLSLSYLEGRRPGKAAKPYCEIRLAG